MRPLVPLLVLLAPALHAAEEGIMPPAKKKLSAVSLLPDGSELQRVMFPRYDEKRRLVGVLKAETMKLVNDRTVSGETISIEFFNDDQSPRGRVDLKRASFDQEQGLVRAEEPVTLRSDRLNANGSGIIYDLEAGAGLLTGPAETWISNPDETAMTSPTSKLRAATAAAGVALAATATAQTPPAGAEAAAIQADAGKSAGELAKAATEARADLGTALAASDAANKAAREFLAKAELDSKENTKPVEPPQAQPLDLKPGPNDTLVACDGGMYFNPDEGVFVYLKNVRVTDPRFTMKGANELKIFLAKKPETKEAKPEKKDGPQQDDLGSKFGEVERIVATGAIVLDQKAVDGNEAIKASGAIFSYNVKDDLVILSGGYPWVVRGGLALRAKQPNLTLRIHPKTGKMDTEGAWETMLPLEQLQKKNP